MGLFQPQCRKAKTLLLAWLLASLRSSHSAYIAAVSDVRFGSEEEVIPSRARGPLSAISGREAANERSDVQLAVGAIVLGDGLATLDIVSVTSDIAAAGTALAGLILVYLGAAAVRYETLDPKDQASARDDYRQHARRAFRGLVIALVAAVAAMTAKSLKAEPYATMIAAMAGLALLMSFFIAVMAAYWILKSLD